MKIPLNIREDFINRENRKLPDLTVRALTDKDGNLGEMFLFALDNKLLGYSGKLGDEYQIIEFEFNRISDICVSIDKPFAYLEIQLERQKLSPIKFAIFDAKILNTIIDTWRLKAKPLRNQDEIEENNHCLDESPEPNNYNDADDDNLTPIVTFCALLHKLVQSDENLSDEEMTNLKLILSDPKLIKTGWEVSRKYSNEQMITYTKQLLNIQQKHCLIANSLDIAMVDGVLAEKEKTFLETLRKSIGIGTDDFNRIYDVLYLKNNLTIFN